MSEHHHHENNHSSKEEHRHTSKKNAAAFDFSKIMQPKILAPIITATVVVIVFLLLLSNGWIVAATVNGSAISRHEVRNLVEKDSGADALRGLISQKLLDQEIKDKKISVTEAQIDEEIATISDLLEKQGLTFAEAIEGQGLTMNEARKQVKRQLELEGLFADSVIVSEEEINAFIESNQVPLPEDEGEKAELLSSVREQMEQEKLYNEYIAKEAELREQASIKFFVDYLDSKE